MEEASVSAGREVELKFLCAPGDLTTVLAAAPAGDDEVHELVSVYFDTPDLALQQAGVSLRVRASKGRRVQTFKRGEGLSREEHEAPVGGDAPNPTLGPLKDVLPSGARLAAVFEVRVTRRQRTLRYQGAEIELALDRGAVVGGAGHAPICEVELELKSGPPQALFALARELSAAAPLYLSFDAKAARGQALAGTPLATRHNGQIVLAPHATAVEAFQAVARDALGQIAANAEALRAAPAGDAVHRLRIAARRLRSALATFKPLLPGAGLDGVKADLTWLSQNLDAARNLDVLAQRVASRADNPDPPPPGFEALLTALAAACRRALAQAVEIASSARFRALMIDTTAWVEAGEWLAAASPTPARSFADDALARRLKRVRKRGRRLRRADDEGRHRLRIQAKKLRYAAEAFASLYPEKAARRFIGRVRDLQEALGDLNDLAVAERLLTSLSLEADAALSAGEHLGLRLAGKPHLVARAREALRRLADADELFA